MRTAQRGTRLTVTVPSSETEGARKSLTVWAEMIHGDVTGRAAPGSVELLPATQPGRARFAIRLPRLAGWRRDVAVHSLAILADVISSRARLGPSPRPEPS